ncbi:hypothetical protein [Thaumasiovibrio sp. DFM-14]|uniref:hypothetical protein n=1 Tax=Thaumasiovibrio sp. DFM-14 TaxID=3384792 RepID=UPI0039A31ED5
MFKLLAYILVLSALLIALFFLQLFQGSEESLEVHCQIFKKDNTIAYSTIIQQLLSDENVEYRLSNYPPSTKWEICEQGAELASIMSRGPYGPKSECTLRAIDGQLQVICNQIK